VTEDSQAQTLQYKHSALRDLGFAQQKLGRAVVSYWALQQEDLDYAERVRYEEKLRDTITETQKHLDDAFENICEE
jgi:phosphoglycerate-specific signal transduction histidine kinase